MFDPEVVELCRDCLLGATLADPSEEDLALVVIALARDLHDTHGADARELLAVAAREAIVALDASDVSAEDFAAALSHLAMVQRRAAEALPAPAPVAL